jgi:hypothetical protein
MIRQFGVCFDKGFGKLDVIGGFAAVMCGKPMAYRQARVIILWRLGLHVFMTSGPG